MISKRLGRHMLLVCFVFGAAVGVRAASREIGRPFAQNYTPAAYRAHNQMWATAQTADGLLYFGNRGRVLEFDGNTWRKIDLPATFVRRLALMPDGRLFVGSIDELGVLARGADGAMAYTSLRGALPPDVEPLGPVTGVVALGDSVFVATLTRVLRWRRGEFKAWPFTDAVPPALSELDGRIYLHRAGQGLYSYNRDNQDFELVSRAAPLLGRESALLARGEPGRPLVMFQNGACYHLRADGSLEPWQPQIAGLLRSQRWRAVLRLADGTFAFGSIAGGVIWASADGRILQRFDERNGLENGNVLSLFQDREGSLWVNTHNGTTRVEFTSPYSLFDRLNGLGRQYVRSFCRHEGILYAATGSGLYKLVPADPASGASAVFERLALLPESAWALASHRSGLLVGSARGIFLIAGTTVTQLTVSSDAVSVLVASRDNPDVFFAGRGRGLDLLEFADGRWQQRLFPGFDGEVRSIVEESGGSLWLGSSTRGIARLTRAPGNPDWFAAQLTTYFESHGLPRPQGWTMVYATPSGPVFTPRTGAYRFNGATERFVADPALCPEGNINATVGTLAAADGGTLWLQAQSQDADATLRLHTLAPTGNATYAWRAEPRKLQERIGWGGARTVFWERNPDGEEALWLSGSETTVRIDLAAPRPPVVPYRALIRTVQLPGQAAQPPPADSRGPRVPFSREPIVFTFSAPRFAAGGEHQFQTRLRGYDDNWSAWSPKIEAAFTNLSGGPFTFEVRARDSDGVVSAPAHYTFSVARPWHLSGWAWAAYVLFGGAALMGFVRVRLRGAERTRQRLERLVEERTRELSLAKQRADDANRAKSAFLANMSHELRTPLNGVIGYAQVLMKDRELSAKNRERASIIQTSGEHLLRMINEVLDFSKIEAGRMELTTTPFHLPQLLRDIAAAISTRMEQKRLEFGFEPAPDLPELVLGDPQKLRQVIDNLLDNAVKFTREGRVRFQVRLTANEVVEFSVSDTGVGIAAANVARVFQPFQQAADGRPPAPGTGLGLAISRRLVELMGGKLDVETRPGAGSRFFFTIKLPVIEASAGQPCATSRRIIGYRGPRRRLLVVDDVATNRHVLRDLLVPLGFEVHEAASGVDALAIAEQLPPDLIFLDLRMPEMDGIEVARRLRERPRGDLLKVIAMSASVLSFNREEAFAAGCDDFLPKPFREEDLLALLALALQLEWVLETGGLTNSRPPFGSLSTRLSAATIEELLASARRGEIGLLRRHLAALHGDPLADALDTLARSYRMEQIRELLEQQVSLATAGHSSSASAMRSTPAHA